jgi:hypothetical protein
MAITQAKFVELPVGTKIKIVAEVGGHSYPVGDGAVYQLYRRSGSNWLISRGDSLGVDGGGGYVRHDEVELVALSRNAKIKELKKLKDDAEAKLIKATHDLEVATKFKNELDELAFAIFMASAGEKTTHKFFYETLKKLGVVENIERKPIAEKAA